MNEDGIPLQALALGNWITPLYCQLRLHTKNGKAYRLSPIMPERIEIYARIMKEMEVRGLKTEA
jgi:hypothetical protein